MQTENSECKAISSAFLPQTKHALKQLLHGIKPKQTHQHTINNYLDQDTIQWVTHNSEDNWDDKDRSDVNVEKNKTIALRNATDRQLAEASDGTRLIKTEGLGCGFQWMAQSLQLNWRRRYQLTNAQQKDLQGL